MLHHILDNTVHLFYPHICMGCGSDLLKKDSLLCLRCIDDLPETNFAQHANNPIEKIFWGRIPLVAAHSQYYFAKDALIQRLIHQLKYDGNKEIGVYLGEMTGRSLQNSNRFKNMDALIPLPLFPEKERKRGYNQATVICEGISNILQIPVLDNVVARQKFTETQTKKHRTERWENVAESFVVKDADAIKGKNLLLVDDVVTTGATFEACGNTLLQIADVQLSIVALANAAK
ncbi:ComF family protein [Ferruginibacter lapsinanis]|uniref:ComF family protein n=1 Tax=Ferruginibacter lapsinanis TaxID=563172 RepID=UPI001E42736D|nr:phosphoribosyltransferase family protein [Ferruginibacter lapsinanis]UEG51078.1 ComF family protein [Ferruginibacter lapsinanis]